MGEPSDDGCAGTTSTETPGKLATVDLPSILELQLERCTRMGMTRTLLGFHVNITVMDADVARDQRG